MTGRLVAKGPDRWEMVVDIGRDPLNRAKRQRRTRVFHGSKRQASKELAAFVTELAGVRPRADVKLSALLAAWLNQAELSPTTRREYSRLVEQRIKPALGSVSLKKLDARDLDEFYRALPLSPSSVRQIHAIIRRALGQAVKWEWVQTNVATNATPPKMRTTRARPPTALAVKALMEAAKKHSAEFGLAVRLAAATGARRGELCAIRWSDVDLDAGVIHIRRSVYVTDGVWREKDTKTHAERTVDIGDSTVEALKLRREMQRADDHAFVLSQTLTGMSPMLPDHLTGYWRRLPGTDGIRLHDLRHWSITEALDQGHALVAVAERHGHKSAKMTLDVYGATADGRGRKIADGIDDVLAGERRARQLGPPRG